MLPKVGRSTLALVSSEGEISVSYRHLTGKMELKGGVAKSSGDGKVSANTFWQMASGVKGLGKSSEKSAVDTGACAAAAEAQSSTTATPRNGRETRTITVSPFED
jgi:hypothetical protein